MIPAYDGKAEAERPPIRLVAFAMPPRSTTWPKHRRCTRRKRRRCRSCRAIRLPRPAGHAVPHPWFGDYVPGVGGVIPLLATQPLTVPDGTTEPLHRFPCAAPSFATPVTRHPSLMPQSWTTTGISRGWVMTRDTTNPPGNPACRPGFPKKCPKTERPVYGKASSLSAMIKNIN